MSDPSFRGRRDLGGAASDDSFEAWYRAEHPRLLASMVLVAGEAEVARDAVDEALVRAYERWSRVSRMASPGGWTHRTALHCLRRRQRRRVLESRLLRRVAAASPMPIEPPAGEVWELVRSLPPRQRTVVALRYIADLSQPEIAEVLGIARSTVSTTLTDAHRALGAVLADDAEVVR